ncbi:GNAT family N-acetyltransferase [Litoreibacter sp.]|nr:GNAT family N-acetyltransferase [Litoreibacter sp.]
MAHEDIILKQFEAGDAAWVAQRHGVLYAEHDGFDDSFEPLVASILAKFLTDHDPALERGWVAWEGEKRVGCIFCVKLDAGTAKLRMFLLEPVMRGRGLGKRLLAQCIGFAREAGYQSMTLRTHESHAAACALYARNGFACVESKKVRSFGQDLVEQTWTTAL